MRQVVRAGDAVQTPLGKGVVRDVRRSGRLVIEVKGRAVVFDAHVVTPVEARKGARAAADASPASDRPGSAHRATVEVDLHGLTVEEALARAEQALNDALLADVPELRLVHGKSGGRIRAALHRHLRAIPVVRAFSLDSRNAGVTVVRL